MKKTKKLLAIGILTCAFLPNAMSYTYAQDVLLNDVKVAKEKKIRKY